MMHPCEIFDLDPAPMSSPPFGDVSSPYLLGGAATAGGLSPLPASLSLFVDMWVSAPLRTIAPRPDYGPQYNGVGECPF